MDYKNWFTKNSFASMVLILTVAFIVFLSMVYLINLENMLKENKNELKVLLDLEEIKSTIDKQHKYILEFLNNNKKVNINQVYEEKQKNLLKFSELDNITEDKDYILEMKKGYTTYFTAFKELLTEGINQDENHYFEKYFEAFYNLNRSLNKLSDRKINKVNNNQVELIEIITEGKLVIILISILSIILGILFIRCLSIFTKD